MSEGPAILNAITDAVLAYRPKPKPRKCRKTKKQIARRKAKKGKGGVRSGSIAKEGSVNT